MRTLAWDNSWFTHLNWSFSLDCFLFRLSLWSSQFELLLTFISSELSFPLVKNLALRLLLCRRTRKPWTIIIIDFRSPRVPIYSSSSSRVRWRRAPNAVSSFSVYYVFRNGFSQCVNTTYAMKNAIDAIFSFQDRSTKELSHYYSMARHMDA